MDRIYYTGEELPEDVFDRLKSASQNYYRFDADEETKKKAIASLADILENVRGEAKDLFNSEFNIPKNEHDKLIFEIVNGYNIRHNNQNQKTDYSKDIWYDWMMQYKSTLHYQYEGCSMKLDFWAKQVKVLQKFLNKSS